MSLSESVESIFPRLEVQAPGGLSLPKEDESRREVSRGWVGMVCKQIMAVSIVAAKRQLVLGLRNGLRELFWHLGRGFEVFPRPPPPAQLRAQSMLRVRGARWALASAVACARFWAGTFWAFPPAFACAAFLGMFWAAGTLGVAACKSNAAMRAACLIAFSRRKQKSGERGVRVIPHTPNELTHTGNPLGGLPRGDTG